MNFFRDTILKLREYKPKRDRLIKERSEKQRIKNKKRQSLITQGPLYSKMNKFLREKALECVHVAEFFRVMNNSLWNVQDDEFFIVNRRWFDGWKQYISYDYIVVTLLEKKKDDKPLFERVTELSVNQLMNNSKVKP